MLCLGIESSCDETALAVVRDGVLLDAVLASQADIHALFGGVVPELASREHYRYLGTLFDQLMRRLDLRPVDLDVVAVSRGPGLLGSLLVVGFALTQNAAASLSGDLLMLAAVIVCGLGYAEGAKLTRELGGWQVICWALVIALPLMLPASLLVQPASWHAISASSWVALGYVSLFSMLIGFIFWYKGLAAGGIAAVGQLQLLQPFFGLGLSAALLHETVSPLMLAVTLGVVLCVVGSRKFGRQRVGAGSPSRD